MANIPEKAPASLAEFYAHYWNKLFNKLNKHLQTHINENRVKPDKIIRGRVIRDTIIRDFVREVAEQAEDAFDSAQLKNNIK